MDAIRKAARVAGALYLLVVLTGPFVLLYVPGKLFVPGNAAATASNMLAHQPLMRAHIIVGLLSELLFIFLVLALYQLFKGISQPLAGAMVVLILIDAPIAFLSVANEVVAFAFVRNAGVLSAFDKPQRDALAMFLLDLDNQGLLVSVLFWGLWLLPLGVLVYRSGFLPRFLGGWLLINGLAYVVISFIGVLSPEYQKMATTIATPILFGEVALMLWLLIMGARPQQPLAVATA